MSRISVANFFYLTPDEQKRIVESAIIDKLPLVTDSGKLRQDRDSSQKCPDCSGRGTLPHICDCEFCVTLTEPCETCDGSGSGLEKTSSWQT